MVTATATVDITDGSTLQSYAWSTPDGGLGAFSDDSIQNPDFTIAGEGVFKDRMFGILAEPPIEEEDLPPNVDLPEGEFPGGLQDRFGVVGLNPFTLEETALVHLEVMVTTTSGTYAGEGEIHVTLPWKVTSGVNNVPIGIPVVLHGKDQATYDWMLDPPGGSAAVLADAMTQNPEFVPDVDGLYEITVTDETGEAAAPTTLMVYAGTWRGVIVDQDVDGRPVGDPACTGCHNMSGVPAPDLFTPWKDTGHAEIFTQNINTSGFWGPQCFQCHTVGYDPDVDNGGIDEADDYDDFLASGLIGNPDPGNWSAVLDDFSDTAQLANIQCENCHGPQQSDAHMMGEPRLGLSSDTCATCHGEPLRHARYQQWQISPHANYELAIDEGESGSCSRCHTGNGFLTWLPILLDDDPATDPTASIEVTWEVDEVHPQTCVTCHDPHAIGTTSGAGTNATVRISGDTPPLIAGFTATDVGRGAICMTCHNSRRGLRNDSVFGEIYRTSDATRAPHGSAQADVFEGQNAYYVEPGTMTTHTNSDFFPDACVTCHMELTPPPDVLSYNQGGSNHTFRAREDICGECHTFDDAEAVEGATEAMLMELEARVEEAIGDLIEDQIAAGNSIDLGGEATITDASTIAEIQIEESRGRQAIIVSFTDTTVVGPARMNDVNVVPPMGDPFLLFDVANPNLVKAGWNYWLIHNDGSHGVHNPRFAEAAIEGALAGLDMPGGVCVANGSTMCLNNDRFRVEVTWRDFQNNTGDGMVVPGASDDSGLFWFFNADNWEMLVKVLNGCGINDRYWVFFAATTNVEFNLTVTDTMNDTVKMYTNPLRQDANAITDTSAFATCP